MFAFEHPKLVTLDEKVRGLHGIFSDSTKSDATTDALPMVWISIVWLTLQVMLTDDVSLITTSKRQLKERLWLCRVRLTKFGPMFEHPKVV